MNPNKKFIAGVVHDLKQKANPDYQKSATKSYASAMDILSVRVADLRVVSKKTTAHMRTMTPEQTIALAKQLIETNTFECLPVAYKALAKYKKIFQHFTPPLLKELASSFDNWLSIDTFASLLAGPAWREKHIPDSTITQWDNLLISSGDEQR